MPSSHRQQISASCKPDHVAIKLLKTLCVCLRADVFSLGTILFELFSKSIAAHDIAYTGAPEVGLLCPSWLELL